LLCDKCDRLLKEHGYSHPGERRIVRELLEQRQREQELRRHWREMGYKFSDDDDNDK